jgi:hypothetical protein
VQKVEVEKESRRLEPVERARQAVRPDREVAVVVVGRRKKHLVEEEAAFEGFEVEELDSKGEGTFAAEEQA